MASVYNAQRPRMQKGTTSGEDARSAVAVARRFAAPRFPTRQRGEPRRALSN
jgi:hypothetical protein